MKSPHPATSADDATLATSGGNVTSHDAASLAITSADVTGGDAANRDAASRDATGGDAPGLANGADATGGDAASLGATSGDASGGGATSGDAAGVGATSGGAVGSAERAIAERNLCGLVGALAKQIEGHIRERAGALDLTAAQAVALRELTGPMTMRDLAERMSCEPSNATFVVDRLEEQGIVERRPHPGDRRAKQLVLTPEGAALRERLIDLLTEASPLARLTSEEQAALNDLLARVVR
ncbi:MarR family winged helix-turn-helix transcriptional regulator [Nonomuraea angiospora]|uniref:DNA-binding MarR family transcriptional regulator n=1 Tax=Nonomuraea angiospora TaxID=46172 RepID=A0ABR9M3T4_9ACTN|nr:MarR family transcriptional regulator [Nonomuraea angiospora]MBE1587586.1 DNA-binding MarR family transcriptional regulator [Nonomuraea angiospora]